MRTHRFSIAILAVGALAVAGCGSDDKSDNSSSKSGGGGSSNKSAPSTSGGGTVKLSATEFKFSPADPTVKKGTATFTVKNDGQTVHALEVEGPNGEKQTPNIQPGKSATLKVDLSKNGKYEFYCPVDGHKQQGMKGEVTVGGGGSSSSSSNASDDSGGSSGGGY